ncbi:putative RNA-binding protein 19 isoform X2 [Chanos chanos]|uniref:Probable RNA-binding protein 19 n=1 Tax=Chanos chanos TaxID=29144 RepID=A0A6J2VHR6_CHACN|nr:probable RNA-binding protein 19 isoform X2 [Chanos chanos]
MSRLIVKNLPNGMKEERFRKMFADFGTLTDCGLKFTKDGKFRKFGFVGFKSEEDAERALKHFNKSFVDTSRVTVEYCKAFGDLSKPRPWSKHTRQPANDKTTEHKTEADEADKKDPQEKKKKALKSVLGELEKDQSFQEFLAVHQNRTLVPTWANDSLDKSAVPAGKDKSKKPEKRAVTDDYLNFDSDESEEPSDNEEEDDAPEEEEVEEKEEKDTEQDTNKEALRAGLSDMDYLRSKVVNQSDALAGSEDEEESDDDEDGDDDEDEEEDEDAPVPHNDSAYESGDRDPTQKSHKIQDKVEPATEYTVKLRGAPYNVTEQRVREFMAPLKPVAIRFGKTANGLRSGYVYVDLNSEEEIKKALKMNKDYMGERYIEVFQVNNFTDRDRSGMKNRNEGRNFVRELREDEEEEDVAESGRLFVRNLPYTCTEEELNELFSKHGSVSDVNFPIDSLTKKPKGFAFVTYMIPENAVQALARLDGHIFQGRMLHILPSRLRKEKAEQGGGAPGSSSFKRQKDAKEKASSGSSHNWNTLFLGTSAVADAIAEKYNTTKSQVLDHESTGSLAVRMALGETQIVQETRQFLLDNGVSLDSFSQAMGPRSTSVILVKNLPAGVQASELEAVFSPFGSLGRVLLPPAGLTAIVEFLEPTEAKRAFLRLAYTKFQHVPLYLEWAPVGVFTTPAPSKTKKHTAEANSVSQDGAPAQKDTDKTAGQDQEEEDDEEEEEDDDESLPGATLFIKNLNFSTTEETLRQTFSKCGEVKSCTISKKRDKSGKMLSMGYGFVEYKKPESAQKAIRQLQHCKVDDHQLELKISERATKSNVVTSRKKQKARKQTTSKILVRNIPFQATVKELRELFCTFGELKTVRLPKKAAGTGSHRGFGFVDFLTKQDAKKAFAALCHSTHLYGRRLVLEWADAEENVDSLRRKTAQHFHDAPKKRKQSEVLESILEQMEVGEEEQD